MRRASSSEYQFADSFNDNERFSSSCAPRHSYDGISRSLNGKGQPSRDTASFIFSLSVFSFLPTIRHVRSLSSRTSFVRRRSEKRSEEFATNSYSPRSVSGRVNGMMPAGVRILYAPVRRRIDESSSLRFVPLITPLCERLIAVRPRLYDRDLSHLPSS